MSNNFQEMDRKTLKAYILSHREDEEAFCVYMDKLHSEAKWTNMPAMKSVEDLERSDFFRKVLQKGRQ
jgi:hypothetical protein